MTIYENKLLLASLKNYNKYAINNEVVSRTENITAIVEAIDPKALGTTMSIALKGKSYLDIIANMVVDTHDDVVKEWESPLQAVVSRGTATVATTIYCSLAAGIAAATASTPFALIGITTSAFLLSNKDKIYTATDAIVDAAYEYADEVWKRNTGESIEETASKLAYKYGETAVATAEFQAKASLELADGLEKLFTTVKEEYKAAYDQSDIVNPLDPPPFPQTTSSLNEELYNKDKTIYEAYDLAKKSTNAMLVYNLALKQAAEHAPDTDKMRDIMYSIITEKKDCFSEGIFSEVSNSNSFQTTEHTKYTEEFKTAFAYFVCFVVMDLNPSKAYV